MAEIKLNNNEKKARKLLTNLRADRNLSYCETLQEILSLLGSDYKVPYSDIAKGLLAAIIYTSLDHDNYRNITMIALCLTKDFNAMTQQARRRMYIDAFGLEYYGANVTEDTIRKDEEKCLDTLIYTMQKRLDQSGNQYLNDMMQLAIQKGFFRSPTILIYLAPMIKPPVIERPLIYKEEIEINEVDERLLDGIKQRIEMGERAVNTSYVFVGVLKHLEAMYYYKNHEKYDLAASVLLTSCNDDGSDSRYEIIIMSVVEGAVMRYSFPNCRRHILELLAESHKARFFHYHNFSDEDPDPTDTYDYLLSLPGSIVFY